MSIKNSRGLFAICVSLMFASVFPCVAQVCTTAPCLTVNNGGWIVGEIKAFAFGYERQAQIMTELRSKGWVECAGQSFDRKDFPQLYKAIGNTWGSADGTNVFDLPDLRGLILRVWNHAGSQAQQAAFGGDPEATTRLEPRAEIPAPGTKGAKGDFVGSIQPGEVGSHTHPLPGYANDHLLLSSIGSGIDFPANVTPFVMNTKDPNEDHAETRPNNVYVMYMIYVGVPVSVDLNKLQRIHKQSD
jgi:hypothetical protein